ncbi:MAG: DUF2171 domain-containing protein [Chloroflexota bacterium]
MTDDRELVDVERSVIQAGWQVFSSDGQRVGVVRSVEPDHFEMELEVLGGSALRVPFDAVEAADDGQVELDVPAETIGLMGWGEEPGSDAG